MDSTALNRYSKFTFRNKKKAQNRVIVPPMASETANTEGFVTENTLRHYERLSSSKAGIVFVEYSYIHQNGRSEENQLGIEFDSQIEGLRKIAQTIHKSNALAGIQLTHSGGKSSRALTCGRLLGPSAISVPVKGEALETPEEMTLDDIKVLQDAFVSSVGRAAKAGFDIVEFHAAHGYGINQFLSPITNRRTDQYGGSPTGNSKILFEIITSSQALFPNILLSVRMPGQDFLEGGMTQDDSIRLAKQLECNGIDLIDVSSGIGGWKRPRDRLGQGYLVSEAKAIQDAVSTPVIGVGGIENGSYIDDAVRLKHLSFAAVGRAILKSPNEWGNAHL